jgi:hypothetical protein
VVAALPCQEWSQVPATPPLQEGRQVAAQARCSLQYTPRKEGGMSIR